MGEHASLPLLLVCLAVAALRLGLPAFPDLKTGSQSGRDTSRRRRRACLCPHWNAAVFGADFRNLTREHFIQLDWKALVMAAILIVATNKFKKLHPITFLTISAIAGILVF